MSPVDTPETPSEPELLYPPPAPPMTPEEEVAKLVADGAMVEVDDGQGGKYLMPAATAEGYAPDGGEPVNQKALDEDPHRAGYTEPVAPPPEEPTP